MAFKEMEVPESPKLYTKSYEGLGGVDFSCDASEVDANRTPTGINMISDEGSFPVKRKGWRCIAELPEGAGKVIKMTTKEITDEERQTLGSDALYSIFAVCENHTYRITHRALNPDTIQQLTPSGRNELLFYFGGDLYSMGTFKNSGNRFIEKYQNVGNREPSWAVKPYVPRVAITMIPSGIGGYSLEPVNLLTPKRSYEFKGDDLSVDYFLYPETIRTDTRYQKILAGANQITVEIFGSDGWSKLTSGWSVSGTQTVRGKNEDGSTEEFTVADAYITFLDPHPATTNEDNIRITFTPFDMTETFSGSGVRKGVYKEERIDLMEGKCSAIYGHTTTDRVFIAGSINKNRVYYSDVNDPTYFPDINYINVGYDTNEVMGMVRVSDSLAVIKSDSVYDSTLYMIRGSFLSDDMVFTVIPTSAKLGTIAQKSIMTLVDEPLFLTRDGIYGIANTYATTEKTIRGRSRYLDKKLLKEEDLANACAVVWDRYYILCVNDHCYILDGRHKEYDRTGNTDYQYEAYYWEDFPAVCFTTFEDDLLFGTEDGKICKYNSDVADRSAYCDNGIEIKEEDGVRLKTIESEEGEYLGDAVVCEWSTPLDSDKLPQYLKTLNKKGNVVSVVPAERCTVDITLIKDDDIYRTIYDTAYASIFSWIDLPFEGFPFGISTTVRDKYPRKKVKKYKRLQMIIKNDKIFESLGIIGITKTYTIGNFAKR